MNVRPPIFYAPLAVGAGLVDVVSGKRGTRAGSPISVASVLGLFPHFAANRYVDFPRPPLDGARAITIAWDQYPVSPAGYSTVMNIMPTVNAAYSILIYQAVADSSYQFVVGPRDGGGNSRQAQFNVGLQQDRLVDSYMLRMPSGVNTPTSQYILYRNGRRLAAAASSPAFGVSTAAGFRIAGLIGATSDPFEGGIGNVAIWQADLLDSEAATWYHQLRTRMRQLPLFAAPAAGGASAPGAITTSNFTLIPGAATAAANAPGALNTANFTLLAGSGTGGSGASASGATVLSNLTLLAGAATAAANAPGALATSLWSTLAGAATGGGGGFANGAIVTSNFSMLGGAATGGAAATAPGAIVSWNFSLLPGSASNGAGGGSGSLLTNTLALIQLALMLRK